MTSLTYSLIVETAKVYRVRDRTRGWANAAVRSWPKGGSIDIQSDYGNYATFWVDIGGGPFVQFLCDVEYDYFMRRVLGGSYRIFHAGDTREAILDRILEARRHAYLSKEKARDLFDEARRYETHLQMSEDALGRQMSERMVRFLDFEPPWCTRDNPQTRGFWDRIWPMLTDAWSKELALQQVPA